MSWPGGLTLTRSEYITRWKNRACVFTQWSLDVADNSVREECPTTDYESSANITFGDAGRQLSITTPAVNNNATLTSAVLDLGGISDGPAYTAVYFNGFIPSGGGEVDMQIAASALTTGPWTYYGGASCASGGWYKLVRSTTQTNAITSLTDITNCNRDTSAAFNNKRYIKYIIRLCRDGATDGATSCANGNGAGSGPIAYDVTFFYKP